MPKVKNKIGFGEVCRKYCKLLRKMGAKREKWVQIRLLGCAKIR